jgi:creatinine amidohydrolase
VGARHVLDDVLNALPTFPFAEPLCWEHLTWTELASLVASRGDDVALLPVGATEQHGPHLPTGTDTIVARELSRAVSERTGCLVLPALPIGCSFGHGMELPGTLSLTPGQLSDIVRGIAQWAATSGVRRFLAVNGHFGNQAALSMAGDHLRHDHPELRFGVMNWWSLTPAIEAEALADGVDVHANRAETSLMLALAPDLVRMEELPGADDPDRTPGLVFRYTAPQLSTNGVTGFPSKASAELGQDLFGSIVRTMSEAVEKGRVEEPPLVRHVVPVAPR